MLCGGRGRSTRDRVPGERTEDLESFLRDFGDFFLRGGETREIELGVTYVVL